MSDILDHHDAHIEVTPIDGDRKKIVVDHYDPDAIVPWTSCETDYPLDLIKLILENKSASHLCEEILRDISPDYSERNIHSSIFGYIPKEEFSGKDILDFGCGMGASTMVLARLLPDAVITGVDLEEEHLEVANARADYYKVQDRVKFILSTEGDKLPDSIDSYDYIVLNAVYEHLLPEERYQLFPLLWKHLKPNGIMFINQTPYRWFPVESHTTYGLPFLNYLPDKVALHYTHKFSQRKLDMYDWQTLLREGIRGGSVSELKKILRNQDLVFLVPSQLGFQDRIDQWYRISSQEGNLTFKRLLKRIFKSIKFVTGMTVLPTLALALQKGDLPENQISK